MTDKTPEQLRREKFGLENDPLAKKSEEFIEIEEEHGVADPLDEYIEKIQEKATNNVDGTIGHYERTFRQWRDHMEEEGRHPACPHKNHVLRFIDYWIEEGNKPSTVRKKVERIENAYTWWQADSEFPHDSEYNPISAATKERYLKDDADPKYQTKKSPKVSLDEIREVVQGIEDVADRGIVGLQLKLGCRSSELANIKLSEIHIDHPDVLEYYPEMGSHEMLEGRPNAVIIPHDRELNKRARPTVLPLDEESRKLLIDWLLVRPDTGDEWLFMTHKGNQLNRTDIRYIWTQYWWPEYEFDEDGEYRSVVPHFARHRFGTFWKSDLDGVNREHVKYMRGDKTDTSVGRAHDALDHYVHTYYEDIEQLYEKMYQLYV